MSFGMAPAGWPPPQADDFPNFIQFQDVGENLGGPDADTVNFRYGFSATRGEGENANVITVDVASENTGLPVGVAGDPLVLNLSNPMSLASGFLDSWDEEVLRSSADVTFAVNEGEIQAAGLYRVTIGVRFDPGDSLGWHEGARFGSSVFTPGGDVGGPSQHYIGSVISDFDLTVTDVYWIEFAQGDTFGVGAHVYTNEKNLGTVQVNLQVEIERLPD